MESISAFIALSHFSSLIDSSKNIVYLAAYGHDRLFNPQWHRSPLHPSLLRTSMARISFHGAHLIPDNESIIMPTFSSITSHDHKQNLAGHYEQGSLWSLVSMQIQIQYNMVLHQLHIRLISIFRALQTICNPLHILDSSRLLYIQIQSRFSHGCVIQQMME